MKKILIPIITFVTFAGYGQHLKISNERLSENWKALKSFGFNEETQGNDRIAFSDFNLAAINMIDQKLTALGMRVNRDAAGNLIATRKGANNQLPPIAFGSHIDCVPNGGITTDKLGF